MGFDMAAWIKWLKTRESSRVTKLTGIPILAAYSVKVQ